VGIIALLAAAPVIMLPLAVHVVLTAIPIAIPLAIAFSKRCRHYEEGSSQVFLHHAQAARLSSGCKLTRLASQNDSDVPSRRCLFLSAVSQ
jgi:hypothetical protein